MRRIARITLGCAMMMTLSWSTVSWATTTTYCVTPPFVQAGILPNLLLLIDNSASMFDLAYVDDGLKHCSNSTTVCKTDADCGAGTCTVFDRVPMYCYDETYRSTNEYLGYYKRFASDNISKQYYQYDFSSSPGKFDPVATFSCSTAAAGEVAQSIPNELCVIDNPTLASTTKVTKFLASGNYLNWLTASKSDVQKQILTGGRYDATAQQLLAESRGCVGQGFIKQPLTADFVNFASPATNDPNTALKVTFRVHGPSNPNNPTAPSQGGDTGIDIFIGNTSYNYKACQDAVVSIATGTNAQVKQDVASCLSTTSLAPGTCKLKNTQTCSTSSECKYNASFADSAFVCSANSTLACSGLTDVTTCAPAAINVCQNKQTQSCTLGNNATCDVTTPVKLGTCGTYSPALPQGLVNQIPASCTTDANCTLSKTTGGTTITYTAACNGYTASTTTNYGPCVNLAPNYGSCVANYYGECVLPASTVVAKTKVAFSQSLQACWALRNNGTALGVDEYNTVINQCPDVYGGQALGPYGITAGSYALLCGINYEGQMYSQSAAGQPWILRTALPSPVPAACSSGDSVQDCIIKIHTQFCNDTSVSNVTDPTDDPSNTTLYGNIPAILSGIGVEAQLGTPLAGDVRARVVDTSNPTGLIQDFANKIRMGVMSFNYDGSLAEATATSGSKYCSNSTSTTCTINSNCPTGGICTAMAPTKVCSNTVTNITPTKCTSDLDCGSGNTCVAATNRDGGRILSYISKGHCSATTTTMCAKNAHCPSGETCVYEGVGDHTAGLVKILDDLKGATWTPFAEAFYNAIGYFAVDKSRDATTNKFSRANPSDPANRIRLDANDFADNMNPVQYSCQQNNILLISDGMSSMDQNSTVNTMAGNYHAPSNQTGACPAQFGSKNLDDMAYLARNYNINEFNVGGGSSIGTALRNSEFINTYVVFNGDTNGVDPTNECNSETLLSRTATNGGTSLYKATNQSILKTTLKAAFDDISAKVSSGTAAAVANNKSGERGANIIQALFYPKWPTDFSKKWLGDIQALWFYVDPIVKFSGIFEDTVHDYQLNLANDRPPGNDSLTVNALWKAGELLRDRAASDRNIYTLLDSSQVLTDAANVFSTSAANRTLLKPLMGISDAQADDIINYVRGSDGSGGLLRSRMVTLTRNGVTDTKEWKLGDVINSTPQIQGNDGLNKYDIEYGDTSYNQFIKSNNYKTNNHVYAGSNDGMLHAFKLGLVSKVNEPANPYKIAQITDTTDIGKEIWAYIPRNVLPYLKNCSEPEYCHQFLVDGAPLLFDASINKYSGCTATNYWECPRLTTLSSNSLNTANTSWRTVLLGSMGMGGATRNLGVACNATSAVAADNNKCINTPKDGIGYSSYFALDVTTPNTPKLLWEFSDASIDADSSLDATQKAATKGLGLTVPAGIQIRINSRMTTDPTKSLQTTNGRWFAVFPSGPTGPIDTGTHQFMGQSDQNLKIYIVDMNPSNGAVPDSSNGAPTFTKCTSAGQTNCNYWVMDTGIKFAFANALFNAAIDIDKGDGASPSNYSDDVVYITYTKASLDSSASPGPYPLAWDKGGVLRLITNNNPDPYTWFTSKLIDDIGPVTRSVDILQDKNNNKLWVFFGEARYFFRLDDLNTTRRIFGVADPCYGFDLTSKNQLSTTLDRCPSVNSGSDPLGNLQNQSYGHSATLTSTAKGWYINLDPANTTYGAERLSGGISSRTNGLVLYTTFTPSMDPCDAGGLPSLWAVNFKTGGVAPPGSLQGKVIMTTSDSPIAKTIGLAGAFTQREGRKLADSISKDLKGMPPPSPPPTLILPAPAKKILHIQER